MKKLFSLIREENFGVIDNYAKLLLKPLIHYSIIGRLAI